MPTLDWIGKDKVINHHLDVPYRVLERKYSFDENGKHIEDNGSENMIIHGDNLEALKSLLPMYEGRIDCIYIDPPYNTGNENWVYNDNVNDPRIKKWLGEVVGKEGEDMSRHDKWLCMMYPRLKLLHRLLSPDGAIFISIDDNEQAYLELVCDEIFGKNCFVANICWQRTYSPRNDSKGISNESEYILVYSKEPEWNPNKLPRTAKMDSKYKNPDGDVALWRTSDAFAPSAATHQGMVYAIQHPFTGEMIYPYNGACWPLRQSDMLMAMQEWGEYELKDLNDAEERARVCGIQPDEVREGVKGIVLSKSIEEAKAYAQMIYDRGKWPKFFFTNKGKGGIARKTYLANTDGRVVTNHWIYDEVGHTDEAKKEIKAIFGDKKVFDTPKPTRLIDRIIKIATNENAIVLDSFAGSATTAHSVLKAGGHRKFILIEMTDYAESVTAKRVENVISGYSNGATDIKGIDGNFSFYELGETLMCGNLINENISVEKIREYIFFSETKKRITEKKEDEIYYLGSHYGSAYYFFYQKESISELNREMLHSIKTKADHYVIYADICTLSDIELDKYHITFKKIPRDITKL